MALLLRNSPQYAASLYGTFSAGGVAVALNTLERAEVLTRQITHSGARMLVVDPAHLEYERLRTLCAGLPVQFVEIAPRTRPARSTGSSRPGVG